MKNLISIIIVFIFSIMLCSAQSKNQLNELLNSSIEKHVLTKEQLIKEGVLLPDYLYKIAFLNDNFPSEFVFSETIAQRYDIDFFDTNNYGKSELKRGIRAFRLLPIDLRHNTLLITIADVLISKKGKEILISSGDYSIYKFKYSCDKHQWELLNIKEIGI